MTTIESVRRIVSETYGSNLADEARMLMDDGRLPRDTLLRLDTVGMQRSLRRLKLINQKNKVVK